jgi:teichuronic acid biosynthesis glycosyltransferase TuaG
MTGASADRLTEPPQVSVVVTIHGTPAPLLAIALSSLLDQTFRPIELILVADGELDPETAHLVSDLAASDPRLVVIEPGRVGRGRALNIGVEASRAPLVAIQDADDASHPRRLEIQVAVMGCLPTLAALGTDMVRANGTELRADWELPGGAMRVSRVNRSLLCSNSVCHSSLMIRRDVMMAVGAYDERRMAQFDYDLLLRTRASGAAIAQCRLPLVLHRSHANQYFEGLQPFERAWSSCRLQLDNIAEEESLERFVYYGVAMTRLTYQVGRSLAWHRAVRRAARG